MKDLARLPEPPRITHAGVAALLILYLCWHGDISIAMPITLVEVTLSG